MKRIIIFLTALSVVFSGCKKDPADTTVEVTSVKLDKTNVTLTVGESVKLTATVSPSNATDKSVTWSSSDQETASVDQTGNVTALKAGTATVTVTAGKKITASCQITVNAPASGEDGEGDNGEGNEDGEGDEGGEGDNGEGNEGGEGDNGEGDEGGEGNEGGEEEEEDPVIAVTGINIEQWSVSITVGQSTTIVATVTPEDATNKNVIWASENTDVATVDSQGKVKGIKAGTAKITATTEDGGFSSHCSVKVVETGAVFQIDGIWYKNYYQNYVEVVRNPDEETKYTGNITIPDNTVTYEDVTYEIYKIGAWAFSQCTELESVRIGEGVREIDARGFYACTNLKELYLPSTVYEINTANPTLSGCKNLEITVSENNSTFYVKDKLLYKKNSNEIWLAWIPEKMTGTVTFDENTVGIAEYAVWGTNFDKLVIPKSVSEIRVRFFNNSKTPVEIELEWTEQEEIDAIQTTNSDPTAFYFRDTDRSKITVTVPAGTKQMYENHWLWSACGTIQEKE